MIHVNFDLRDQENCFIGLSFSEDDVLAIINMQYLRQNKINIAGIEGMASLGGEKSDDADICFFYKNGTNEAGTVFYPYKKLTAMLNQAFSELSAE